MGSNLFRIIAVDKSYLEKSNVPGEKGRFTFILAMIILLGVSTGISGWYMFYLNFNSNTIAITMGVLMTMVFLNIYLVSFTTFRYPMNKLDQLNETIKDPKDEKTIKKLNKLKERLQLKRRDFTISAIFRAAILSFLGLFFTIPLCLLIFKEQLNQGADFYRKELIGNYIIKAKKTHENQLSIIKTENQKYINSLNLLNDSITSLTNQLKSSNKLSAFHIQNITEDLIAFTESRNNMITSDSLKFSKNIQIIKNDREQLEKETENIKKIVSHSMFFTFRIKSYFKHNTVLAILSMLAGMFVYISPLLMRLMIINNYLKNPTLQIEGYDYFLNLNETKKREDGYNETKIEYANKFKNLMREGKIIAIYDKMGDLVGIPLSSIYTDAPLNKKIKTRFSIDVKEKGTFIADLYK